MLTLSQSSPDASSIALSIDELRWLHASAAMDPVRFDTPRVYSHQLVPPLACPGEI